MNYFKFTARFMDPKSRARFKDNVHGEKGRVTVAAIGRSALSLNAALIKNRCTQA
jgi:hypothetical protein